MTKRIREEEKISNPRKKFKISAKIAGDETRPRNKNKRSIFQFTISSEVSVFGYPPEMQKNMKEFYKEELEECMNNVINEGLHVDILNDDRGYFIDGDEKNILNATGDMVVEIGAKRGIIHSHHQLDFTHLSKIHLDKESMRLDLIERFLPYLPNFKNVWISDFEPVDVSSDPIAAWKRYMDKYVDF